MKYEFCEDCYFHGVEPAICDECEDGDQFEPAEADDDAYDRLCQLTHKFSIGTVIPIRPIQGATQPEAEAEEPELSYG